MYSPAVTAPARTRVVASVALGVMLEAAAPTWASVATLVPTWVAVTVVNAEVVARVPIRLFVVRLMLTAMTVPRPPAASARTRASEGKASFQRRNPATTDLLYI